MTWREDWKTSQADAGKLLAINHPLVSLGIPIGQSVITAVVIAIAAGVYARSWDVFALAYAFTQAGAWCTLWIRWIGAAARVEKMLAGNVSPANKLPEPARLRVELHEQDGAYHRGVFLDLELDQDQLTNLARGLLQGSTFSENQWSGRGRPFSRRQFRRIRDEFVARGLIQWRRVGAPQQGLELTRTGSAVCRYLADVNSPTLPREVYHDVR